MKPNNDNEAPHENLPDASTLATLAAQARFCAMDSKGAARGALELWRAACRLLESHREAEEQAHALFVAPLEGLREPKTWPAAFSDFLKYVVRGEDTGKQLSRFRGFLRQQAQREDSTLTELELLDAVQKKLAQYQAEKLYEEEWRELALEFLSYWANHTSKEKRKAGRKGGRHTQEKARQAKSTQEKAAA